MSQTKYLFIDRDGTLITEPEDQQVDSLQKLQLEPNVIPALLQLQQMGFQLVMVSNQDGLGTVSFPTSDFQQAQQKLLDLLTSQGVHFHDILICPHVPADHCQCRKPRVGLVLSYLQDLNWDRYNSYVIGDRQSDLDLAHNMGISGILYANKQDNWLDIVQQFTTQQRTAQVHRRTKETDIKVSLNLDRQGQIHIATGIGFFDHMLEQIAKHANINLKIVVLGDLHIDEHHTVEDVALALGEALRLALGDKLGIERYGFLLPMDESLAQVALDLSGRPYFVFSGDLKRETVGGFASEMVSHFFRSLAQSLAAAINIKVEGENAHHMIEAIFKALGRALKMAIAKNGYQLPSTKGVL
jgi:imidazoleglycerol-phosphate dehydratase / histidinol-phosphatase